MKIHVHYAPDDGRLPLDFIGRYTGGLQVRLVCKVKSGGAVSLRSVPQPFHVSLPGHFIGRLVLAGRGFLDAHKVERHDEKTGEKNYNNEQTFIPEHG